VRAQACSGDVVGIAPFRLRKGSSLIAPVNPRERARLVLVEILNTRSEESRAFTKEARRSPAPMEGRYPMTRR